MPPEPNPDGSYTFSQEEIDNLRSYFSVLKNPNIEGQLRDEYLKEAEALLPTPQHQQEHAQKFEAIEQKRRDEYEAAIQGQILEHQKQKPPEKYPELLAIEKGLKERYEKDLDLLQRSHRREFKNELRTGNDPYINERQDIELNRLKKTYENDLKRYTQEYAEAQKLMKEIEERSAKQDLKPDAPKRTL